MKKRLKQWGFTALMFTYVMGPLVAVFIAAVLLWNQYVFWTDIAIMAAMFPLTAFGITIGFHRMLTHEGFQTYPPIRALLLILGTMAMAPPLSWASTHVAHHAHSDHEGDPHSPLEGFWHAHFGWILQGTAMQKPEEYAAHLCKDPVNVFIHKTSWFWMALSLAIPYAIGGWTGLVWGGGVRVFLTNHIMWSVNSVCHCFGKRDFETTDESRNHWVVGLLAFGEGWHNNHHAFPRNAFHGLRWYQFDASGLIIRALERTGLIWDVQRITSGDAEKYNVYGERMYETVAQLKIDLGQRIDMAREEMNQMIQRLPPAKVASVRMAHEKTMQRFAAIQMNLEKRRNMRKTALLKREKEVAELLAMAKQRMRLAEQFA